MNFRKIELNGIRLFLGRNAENNDELMRKFKDKKNTILHTEASGSPFCVIEKLKPSKEEIYSAGSVCAKYSQDWRNRKSDIEVHIFTGKDISKRFWMKKGSWSVKNLKKIKVKKQDILKFERSLK
ncbi:MAG: NFACT RNA binding domain-containing protein [Candidatus Pacearchaeota archaeon]